MSNRLENPSPKSSEGGGGGQVKVRFKKSSINQDAVRLALQLLTFLVVLVALAMIIVSVARSSKADVEIRRTIEAVSSRIVGGGGDANVYLRGKWIENYANFDISYDFRYNVSASPIQSILVRGPIALGSETGPILIAVCGSPGTTVCDLTSNPGRIMGNLKTIEPANVAALPVMRQIRENPDFYYLEVWTASAPTEPGAARSPMYFSMGPDL